MNPLRGPDFFIVGAPKSGTTSLHAWLGANPDVYLAPREPHYFSPQRQLPWGPKTWDEYVSLFKPAQDVRRLGEKAVWYLSSETAPSAIAEYAPEAQIVIALRNPVDAMRSLHSWNIYYGEETIDDFFEALGAEPDRRQGRLMPVDSRMPWNLLYRDAVRYAPQIERYRSTFGDDRVHLVLFDDLTARPEQVYRELTEFLGVAPERPGSFDAFNTNKEPRSESLQRLLNSTRPRWLRLAGRAIPAELRRRLQRRVARANVRERTAPEVDIEKRRQLVRELAPEVRELERLIDRDLGRWLEPST